MIKVGEIYGDDEDFSGGVKIKIDSIDKDKICATVISVNEFWDGRKSMRYRKSDGTEVWSTPFEVGQVLEFGLSGGKIENPKHLPWFVFNIDKKYFLHYR